MPRNPNTGTVYYFPNDHARYLGRVRSQYSRDTVGYPCEHGHDDCALWFRGPCADEIAAKLEG